MQDLFGSIFYRHGRKTFTSSVKELLDYFGADGIDLDWEYQLLPVIRSSFSPKDKDDFTNLVKRLRSKLGKEKEISFAAGASRIIYRLP